MKHIPWQLRIFFTSISQFVVFGAIYSICLVFNFLPPSIFTLFEILLPILGGITSCFLVNRKNCDFKFKSIFSIDSMGRLVIRLLAVITVLIICYIASNEKKYEIFLCGEWRENTNNLRMMFEAVLCNFCFYLLVTIYPVLYALVECLFVTNECTYL